MRTLDSSLTTAQQAASREPYVRLYLDNEGGTTHTIDTTNVPNVIVYVEQWEEGYAGLTTVRMINNEGFFTDKDLRGYLLTVGWGYKLNSVPDSTWYSNAAPMRVLVQRDTSYEGHSVTELIAVSKWAELAQDYIFQGGKKLSGEIAGVFTLGELVTGGSSSATGRVSAIGHETATGVGYIIVTRVSGTFEAAETCTGGTSAATISDIATPTDNYGALVYESGDTTTEARIEALTGLTVDVDEDDPNGSMADSPKLEVAVGTPVRQVLRRMLLRSKCGLRYESDGHLHAFYLNTEAATQYRFAATHAMFLNMRERAYIIPNTVYVVSEEVNVDGAPAYIGTANDADSVAAFGTLVAPIQVDPDIASQEDADNRASAWVAQMVAQAYQGQIVAPLECGLEVYDMVSCVDTRLNAISKGRVGRIERVFEPSTRTYEVRINLGSLYSVPGAMDAGPGSMESDLRDLTNSLDGAPPRLFTPLAAWQLLKQLLPYTIDVTFTADDDDDVSWSSGTITFANGQTQAVSSGSLNLANSNPYHIYCDLSDAAPATLKSSQTFGDATGGERILLAFAVKGANTSTKALVVAGTRGPKLFIDTLSSITGNFGLITAGEIRVGTGTLGSNFTGWRFWVDTNVGRMAGYNSDTIQWYSDTDGKLYAGAGAVVMDATNGIVVTGEKIYFSDGASGLGIIKQLASYLWINSNTYTRLGDEVRCSADLDPLAAGSQDQGNATYYWDAISAKGFFDLGCPLPLIVSSLKQIKGLRTKVRRVTLEDVDKEAMGKRAKRRVEAAGGQGNFEEWDLASFPEEVLSIPTQEEREDYYLDYLKQENHHPEIVESSVQRGLPVPPEPKWQEPKTGIVLNELVYVLAKAVRELAEKVDELEGRLR